MYFKFRTSKLKIHQKKKKQKRYIYNNILHLFLQHPKFNEILIELLISL